MTLDPRDPESATLHVHVPDKPRPLLKAEELAAYLGVKRSWVYAEARAGRIPHVRLGRYTRFQPDSIEIWAAQRERGATARRDIPTSV
jgi:excisionase family DNA binding protein